MFWRKVAAVALIAAAVAPSSAVAQAPTVNMAVRRSTRNTYYGYASVYSRGVMERVARVRHMAQAHCMIATPFYDVGKWVTVTSRVTGAVALCKVVDVPQPRHMKLKMRRREYVEFNAGMAWRMCHHAYPGAGPIRSCPVILQG